jgi:transketolase
MRSFGLSAPGKVAQAHFGFDVEHVVAAARQQIALHPTPVPGRDPQRTS